jgi:hypothetical protein
VFILVHARTLTIGYGATTIARTQDTGSDDIGWTFTAGGGLGVGAEVSGSFYYEVSTCNTLPCFGG